MWSSHDRLQCILAISRSLMLLMCLRTPSSGDWRTWWCLASGARETCPASLVAVILMAIHLVYNIIWHDGMVPRTVYTAADYQRVSPLVLDREVKIKDMSDFFVTFMETDLLGMICTTHKQLADQREAGSLDPDCIKLASLASTAVDYSKTGIAVNHKQIPRNDRSRFRPDFMAPTPRVVVSGEGLVDLEEEEEADDDAFEGLDSERRPYRYYDQQEYRAIAPRSKRQGIMTRLLAYLKQNAANVFWTQHSALASAIRSSFENSLADLLYEYEPTPHHPLSETEAFSGQILGRQSGPQGKPLRELAKTMTERFEMVVEHARMRIRFGDAVYETQDIDDLHDPRYHDRDVEALPRAIACLHVALNEEGYHDRKIGELKSFKYIAAQIALEELPKMFRGMLPTQHLRVA
ncbi:putative RNA-dependent RNA polymerase 2 [Pseudocercospora fuligena]|uniref:RNA-dependent RNA polymerase n=1 Tax=Pseudocercospora fuligena TaxID=685502 RepID=A0A8H6RNB7_9PEZI|nr:putative RNA-dependent RNA polymerase 2 [Pseudocercospora fuligena]